MIIGEILGVQVENYVDNRNICVVVHSEKDIMLLPDTKIIVVSNKEKAKKSSRSDAEIIMYRRK